MPLSIRRQTVSYPAFCVVERKSSDDFSVVWFFSIFSGDSFWFCDFEVFIPWTCYRVYLFLTINCPPYISTLAGMFSAIIARTRLSLSNSWIRSSTVFPYDCFQGRNFFFSFVVILFSSSTFDFNFCSTVEFNISRSLWSLFFIRGISSVNAYFAKYWVKSLSWNSWTFWNSLIKNSFYAFVSLPNPKNVILVESAIGYFWRRYLSRALHFRIFYRAYSWVWESLGL